MIIKAKKSLGQNWLTNEKVVAEIVAAGKIEKGERVLEVGPGQGILTAGLLKAGARVVAVEKDDQLIENLRRKFELEIRGGKLEIIHADILDFDLKLKANEAKSYKVVANLPYYITGEFLKKFLTTQHQPSLMVLMLQKEVAERIIAKNKKESVLSLSVKVYGEPKYVKTVARGNFSPAPKVNSAILLIENISKKLLAQNKITEREFFSTIKQGFRSKRKKLRNNLPLAGALAASYGEKRAEDLQLGDWIKLCQKP